RRRHTRSKRDWSSDVCSSDLTVNQFTFGYNRIFNYITSQGTGTCASAKLGIPGANLGCSASNTCSSSSCGLTSINIAGGGYWSQIGRASCRERGKVTGGESEG